MLYEKIKKEHVFIFVILLASLIVFSSFDEFGYTGLVTKEKNNEVTGNFAFISFGDFFQNFLESIGLKKKIVGDICNDGFCSSDRKGICIGNQVVTCSPGICDPGLNQCVPDTEKPTSLIINPIDQSILITPLSRISGTALDNVDIKEVKIYILDMTRGGFFYGGGWTSPQTNPVWLQTSGTIDWSYAINYQNGAIWAGNRNYKICSKAYDISSNIQEPETCVTFTTDLDPPTLSITSLDQDSTVPYETGDNTPTIMFSSNEEAYCKVSLTDQGYSNMQTSCNLGEGTNVHTCVSPDLGNQAGQKKIYLACKDQNGNEHSNLNNLEIIFNLVLPDTTPPVITFVSIDEDSIAPYETTNQNPTVIVNTNENANCRIAKTDLSYSGMASVSDCSSGEGTMGHTCVLRDQGLGSSGAKMLYVSCKDERNNENVALPTSPHKNLDISLTLIQDTNYPVVSLKKIDQGYVSLDGKNITSDSTPTIEFTTNENAICRNYTAILTNDNNDPSYDQMNVDCGTALTTTHSCTTINLKNSGPKSVYIACKDGSNNKHISSNNYKFDFIFDKEKPNITLLSHINNQDLNNAQVTISGNTSDDIEVKNVQVKLNSGDYGNVDFLSAKDSKGNYTWKKSLTLTSGSNQIKVKAFDSANNESNEITLSLRYTAQVPTTETGTLCSNNIDDDLDGPIDELDMDCSSYPTTYIKLKEAKVYKKGSDSSYAKPLEDADVNLRCEISLTGSARLSNAKTCITGNIGTTKCNLDDNNDDDKINFLCNVGNLGYKNATCTINQTCVAFKEEGIEKRQLNYSIEVSKPIGLCSEMRENKVRITNIDFDDEEYEKDDELDISATLDNNDNEDQDVNIDVILYDINKNEELKKESITETIPSEDETDIDLTFTVPRISSVTDSKFKIYVKISETGICSYKSKEIRLKKTSTTTSTCSGTECKSGDNTKICSNGQWVSCQSGKVCSNGQCITISNNQTVCTTGQTRACGQGICTGTQLCTSNQWGTCLGGQSPATEICTDSLDNDCDGSTDVSDSNCDIGGDDDDGGGDDGGGENLDDRDLDDLPDDWEMENFGTLNYNSAQDFDEDEFTNKEEYDAGTDPTDINNHPEKPKLLPIILIVVAVLLIAFFFVWFFALRKPGNEIKISKDSRNELLKKYVQSYLKQGHSKEEIRRALRAKGVKEEDIEIALKN